VSKVCLCRAALAPCFFLRYWRYIDILLIHLLTVAVSCRCAVYKVLVTSRMLTVAAAAHVKVTLDVGL